MTVSRYEHLVRAALDQPWALLPSKLAELRALLTLRAHGLRLTDEEIQARIGDAKAPKAAQQTSGVAVVPVMGVIAHRMNLFTEISGGTSTEKLSAQLRALIADPAVTAIVLDVDSPGGGVFGVPELFDDIRQLKGRGTKRIVAVANALMASAAYWIGSAADELVVTPSGQVGSIGVFTIHEDHSQELAEAGIDVTVIRAGAHKAEDLPFEPLSEDAKAAIQAQVDHYYSLFTRDVAKGRRVSVETVRASFGGGRTVNAKEALRLGMVDRIATLDDVVSDLLAGHEPSTAVAAATLVDELHVHQDDAVIAALETANPATPVVPTPPAETREGLSEVERRRLSLRLLTLGD